MPRQGRELARIEGSAPRYGLVTTLNLAAFSILLARARTTEPARIRRRRTEERLSRRSRGGGASFESRTTGTFARWHERGAVGPSDQSEAGLGSPRSSSPRAHL